MSLSRVTNTMLDSRAVAMMIRSAGSPGGDPGNSHEPARISIVSSGIAASIVSTVCRNHFVTGMASTIRFLRTRLAISHTVIGETFSLFSVMALRASLANSAPSASHSTAQVSSRRSLIEEPTFLRIPFIVRRRREIGLGQNRDCAGHATPRVARLRRRVRKRASKSHLALRQVDGLRTPSKLKPGPRMRMAGVVVAPPSFMLVSTFWEFEAQNTLDLSEAHSMGCTLLLTQELRQRFVFAHDNLLPL